MTIAVGSTTAVGSITMVGLVSPVTTVDPVGPVGVIANTTLGAGDGHGGRAVGQRFFTPSTA